MTSDGPLETGIGALQTKEAIQTWLIAHIAEELGIGADAIDPRSSFDDLGMASRDVVTLSGDLENWLGRKLSPTLLWEHPSVALLSVYLSGESSRAVDVLDTSI